MNETKVATRLAQRTGIALLVAAFLVTICYYFVDRPVAFYVHDNHISSHVVLKWLTYPPPILQAWMPLAMALMMLLWIRGPLPRWGKVLLALGISIIVADQFRESLSWVFGRYWPETWRGNPSLISNGAFGFHFFHEGSDYGSFPSGHVTRMVALAAVLWIAYPKGRMLYVLMSLAVSVGLVGMNYHFVGDEVAGAFVGGIVGVYTAYWMRLNQTGVVQ